MFHRITKTIQKKKRKTLIQNKINSITFTMPEEWTEVITVSQQIISPQKK